MLKRLILLFGMLILAFGYVAAPSQAQDEPQGETGWSFEILESDANHLLLELTVPAFDTEVIQQDGVTYQRLNVGEDWSAWGEVGQPELPRYHVQIGLPTYGEPEITVLESESQLYSGYNIYPNPDFIVGGSADAPDIVDVFAIDEATYNTDTVLPGPLFEAAEFGLMRDQGLFNLRLAPFQYNPVRQELTVIQRMRVLINFPQSGIIINSAPAPTPPTFQKMFRQFVVNYDDLPQSQTAPASSGISLSGSVVEGIGATNATYIIISHPNFYNKSLDLATYRAGQGEDVAIVKSTDIYDEYNSGTKSAEAIRDYLVDAYANWSTKPVYVVLIGDGDATALETDPNNSNLITGYDPSVSTDFIPSHYETLLVFGPAPIDSWYAKIHGDDIYPDLIIGRIPARKSADVQTVIDKVQAYEQSPASGDWTRKAVLVADDADPGFGEDMDYVADLLPSSVTPTKLYSGGTNVQDVVGQGALLLAYSGHGSQVGWSSWKNHGNIFQQHYIDDLDNGNKLPFMTVANCSNGYFAYAAKERVLAEEFLLVPNEGGIASWAPAAYSFPSVNTEINEDIHEALFTDGDIILASAATTARISFYINDGRFPLNLFEVFTFFGDPAVKLSMPPTLTLGGQISDATAVTGTDVTYTLTYNISGADQARDLTLVNTLPDHVTFQSASVAPSAIDGQKLTWNLGTVAKGTYQITITATVANDGSLSNDDILSNLAQLTDATGGEKEIQVDASVLTTDVPPVASYYTSAPDQVGQTTTFYSLSAGSNLTYEWNFGDGTIVTGGSTISHTYAAQGTYNTSLTITNGAGSDSASLPVEIQEAGAEIGSPIASFTSNSPIKLGETTVFINTSQDGGDAPENLVYSWNFGDGSTSSEKDPIHIYTTVGDYTVRLTVTNSATSANSDSVSNVVTIESARTTNNSIYLPLVIKP